MGEIPRDLLYDGEFIWVANMGSDSVSKLTLEGQQVGEFPCRGTSTESGLRWVARLGGDGGRGGCEAVHGWEDGGIFRHWGTAKRHSLRWSLHLGFGHARAYCDQD